MELKGTVLNVVDFGAFIDIGLKDSGLVHISQMANRYVKSPYDVVAVGDVVTVWVLAVDKERRRVSLTMIQPGTERKPPEKKAPPPRREGPPPRREGRHRRVPKGGSNGNPAGDHHNGAGYRGGPPQRGGQRPHHVQRREEQPAEGATAAAARTPPPPPRKPPPGAAEAESVAIGAGGGKSTGHIRGVSRVLGSEKGSTTGTGAARRNGASSRAAIGKPHCDQRRRDAAAAARIMESL